MKRHRILLVDDKPSMLEMLKTVLSVHHDVSCARTAAHAAEILKRLAPSVVVTDVRMPGTDGMQLLRWIKKEHPATEVILITAYGDVPQAVEAMKLGAFHYLTKPFEPAALVALIDRALEHRDLLRNYSVLKSEVESRLGFSELVGRSPGMVAVCDLIRKAAPVDANVLIEGETGTGKELVARAIHRESAQSKGPFVVVHCAGVPPSLMESELFGHVKGAFSGATANKQGQAEQADGGTLLLDDIHYLPMELQAKVNRLVQEKEIKPVGSNDWRKVNARIVATSNRPLKSLVDTGEFREDLYFRLSVMTIQIPPLRERVVDLPLLVDHFIKKHSKRIGRKISGVHPEVLEMFSGYSWPGNVRELENVLERAIILCGNSQIRREHIYLEGGAAATPQETVDTTVPYADALEQATERAARAYLVKVLKMFGGNVTRAAAHAGMKRQSLHRLMNRYNIRVDREVGVKPEG